MATIKREMHQAVEAVLHDGAPLTPCPDVPSDDGAFFQEMMKAGVSAPIEMKPLAKYGRRGERYLHIRAIATTCAAKCITLFWTGQTQYGPRDRKSLTFFSRLHKHRPYRTFIIPNPMTGESAEVTSRDGGRNHLSWACKATVATAPLVVCELDQMLPEQQLLFWSGVIDTKSLDVRSLVWSGNKSYHALIKVPSDRERGEYVTYLQSILPGVDSALMDVAGLTRLAGGINEKTGNLQRLVWRMP